MQRLNVLFSTSRQWNCGDEFILFGVRRLLGQLPLEYNSIIYNRHPSVTPAPLTRSRPWSRLEPLPHLDNSFDVRDPVAIDYVVFAGTPEWHGGSRVDPLLHYISRTGLRCAFIGVGLDRVRKLSGLLRRVVEEQGDVVVARDPFCYEAVRTLPHAYAEVCPALFCASGGHVRHAPARVAVVIQARKTRNHSVPDDVATYCAREYARLEKAFDVTYIAHYIDDVQMARAQGLPVLYSGYAEDYERIYDEFDVVVSTRVHGCGIAASLGIPSIIVPHDGRYATALGFRSHVAEPGTDLVALIAGLDVAAESAALLRHRAERERVYQQLLRERLTIAPAPPLTGETRVAFA